MKKIDIVMGKSKKITRKMLREMIISEFLGRNWHTTEEDPITWADKSNLEISTHKNAADGKWHVYIYQRDDLEIDDPLFHGVFQDGDEANHWARMENEKLQRKIFSQGMTDDDWIQHVDKED